MGDRYELSLDCAYCGNKNKDVWYAPTCNSITFMCDTCNKLNFINSDFKAVKIEDVQLDDIRQAFGMATNVSWDEEEFERICESMFKDLKS